MLPSYLGLAQSAQIDAMGTPKFTTTNHQNYVFFEHAVFDVFMHCHKCKPQIQGSTKSMVPRVPERC